MTRNKGFLLMTGGLAAILIIVSLAVGKYHFSLSGILSGGQELKIFTTLRVSRTAAALLCGFVLGVTGFVCQTVFQNPLASPDIIGVSSGASAGAAAGILFFGTTAMITVSSFAGAMLAMLAALALASADRSGRKHTIVLAGIAVHAAAQAVLMGMKLLADPERELAAIEFWIMGSFAGIRITDLGWNVLLCAVCTAGLFLLHRQILLLSAEEGEAKMLGVSVGKLRLLVLLLATLAVSSVVSLTGLISFAGLLAPHAARLMTGDSRKGTMLLSGLSGSCILLAADILARSAGQVELPVSIFTSLIGAPFLIVLALGKGTGVRE